MFFHLSDHGMVWHRIRSAHKYINIHGAYNDIVTYQKFKVYCTVVRNSKHMYAGGSNSHPILLCR